jgi:hypothetical protein
MVYKMFMSILVIVPQTIRLLNSNTAHIQVMIVQRCPLRNKVYSVCLLNSELF